MGWIFPVAPVGDRKPVLSSAWRSADRPDHTGVDIMFRRMDEDPPWPGHDTTEGTRRFVYLAGALAIAARAGRVVYAKEHTNGLRVRLAHDDGLDTLYIHLATIAVVPGQDVEAGQVVGMVGGDPSSGPGTKHLHFEVRERSTNQDLDPERYLVGSAIVPALTGLALFGGLMFTWALFGGP